MHNLNIPDAIRYCEALGATVKHKKGNGEVTISFTGIGVRLSFDSHRKDSTWLLMGCIRKECIANGLKHDATATHSPGQIKRILKRRKKPKLDD